MNRSGPLLEWAIKKVQAFKTTLFVDTLDKDIELRNTLVKSLAVITTLFL